MLKEGRLDTLYIHLLSGLYIVSGRKFREKLQLALSLKQHPRTTDQWTSKALSGSLNNVYSFKIKTLTVDMQNVPRSLSYHLCGMQLVKSINKLGLASDIDIPLQKKSGGLIM